MKINDTPLQDAFIIEPEPFVDDRGLFARVFCHNELRNILSGKNIVEIHHGTISVTNNPTTFTIKMPKLLPQETTKNS